MIEQRRIMFSEELKRVVAKQGGVIASADYSHPKLIQGIHFDYLHVNPI